MISTKRTMTKVGNHGSAIDACSGRLVAVKMWLSRDTIEIEFWQGNFLAILTGIIITINIYHDTRTECIRILKIGNNTLGTDSVKSKKKLFFSYVQSSLDGRQPHSNMFYLHRRKVVYWILDVAWRRWKKNLKFARNIWHSSTRNTSK